METSLLIEEGDTVVAEWTTRGTHIGPLAMPDGTQIPATGKTVEIVGVSVVTVKDGKVVSQRDYFDNVAVMSQLRMMPAPDPPLSG
jgi:predicted ester cyclase